MEQCDITEGKLSTWKKGGGYLSCFGEGKALGGDIELRFPAPPRDVQGWEDAGGRAT